MLNPCPRIRANLLTVIAEGDHITPPCQSQTIQSKVSSKDKELFRIPGGHIGIMAGSGASKHTRPHMMPGWPHAPNSARAAVLLGDQQGFSKRPFVIDPLRFAVKTRGHG